MTKCPNCGYEVSFNEKFCGKCGTKIHDENGNAFQENQSAQEQSSAQENQQAEQTQNNWQSQQVHNQKNWQNARQNFSQNEFYTEFKKGWDDTASLFKKAGLRLSRFLGSSFMYFLLLGFIALIIALITALVK